MPSVTPTISSQRGLRDVIAPHRSYRRLPVDRTGAVLTVPAVLLIEVLVAVFAQRVADAMAWFGALVADREGLAPRQFDDPFVFVTTHPMTFAMRHSDWRELLVVMVVCALTVLVLSLWTRLAAPLRFFVNLNALIIGGAALYLLLVGRSGYDSAAFSELMLRTALLTWLAMPVFVGLFASLFPFSFAERLLFVTLAVAYDIPLSIVRYGLFVGLLGRTSTIVMADLYLMFGPLLDAVPIICFFSIFLVRVARKLNVERSVWGWL